MKELSLKICEKEEQELILKHFFNQDAYILGSYITDICIQNNIPVIISIEKNNQIIFQYAHDGTSNNNNYWIQKKINVVKRFDKSSAYMTYKLKEQNLSFEQKYGNSKDYALTPGAFPIRVENVGTVGIIAISGLSSEEDHQLIIDGLKYIKERQEKR